VCRHLRDLFATDAAEYMMSLTGSDALRELSSPGKSGSVFYLSHDDRFLIKTMRKTEMHTLLNMLPAYYRHVRTYDNTLLTKFYGLHRIKPAQGRKVGTKQYSVCFRGYKRRCCLVFLGFSLEKSVEGDDGKGRAHVSMTSEYAFGVARGIGMARSRGTNVTLTAHGRSLVSNCRLTPHVC
jgi:hypothetical protein